MKAKTKLALRRFILRWLRKLFDLLEDRLHAEEVSFREECEEQKSRNNDLSGREQVPASRESVSQKSSRPARGRKRGCTASAFDLRFSSQVPQ